MKGGIFFKFRASELRDEPASGSLFGSARIPVNEKKEALCLGRSLPCKFC
jgi:hypothetical protein